MFQVQLRNFKYFFYRFKKLQIFSFFFNFNSLSGKDVGIEKTKLTNRKLRLIVDLKLKDDVDRRIKSTMKNNQHKLCLKYQSEMLR